MRCLGYGAVVLDGHVARADGIVDEHIYASGFFIGLLDRGLDSLYHPRVEPYHIRNAAGALLVELLSYGLGLFKVADEHVDLRALFDHLGNSGKSYACGASGDDADFTGAAHSAVVLHVVFSFNLNFICTAFI